MKLIQTTSTCPVCTLFKFFFFTIWIEVSGEIDGTGKNELLLFTLWLEDWTWNLKDPPVISLSQTELKFALS